MWQLILVALLIVAQAPGVTLSTDKTSYSPGEQVTITIQVNAADLNATWLWLYIDKPDGHNAFFTQLDAVNQTVTWRIPVDASEGTYTVTVTWHHKFAQAAFIISPQPISEFPIAPLVLILATTVAFAALSWRKTSARAKASPLDSLTYGVHRGVWWRCRASAQQTAQPDRDVQ